jgi:hypothetical protein
VWQQCEVWPMSSDTSVHIVCFAATLIKVNHQDGADSTGIVHTSGKCPRYGRETKKH